MSAKDVCAAISAASRARPQLRIGQLIENAVSVASGFGSDGSEIYYLTDEELVSALHRYAELAKTGGST